MNQRPAGIFGRAASILRGLRGISHDRDAQIVGFAVVLIWLPVPIICYAASALLVNELYPLPFDALGILEWFQLSVFLAFAAFPVGVVTLLVWLLRRLFRKTIRAEIPTPHSNQNDTAG